MTNHLERWTQIVLGGVAPDCWVAGGGETSILRLILAKKKYLSKNLSCLIEDTWLSFCLNMLAGLFYIFTNFCEYIKKIFRNLTKKNYISYKSAH